MFYYVIFIAFFMGGCETQMSRTVETPKLYLSTEEEKFNVQYKGSKLTPENFSQLMDQLDSSCKMGRIQYHLVFPQEHAAEKRIKTLKNSLKEKGFQNFQFKENKNLKLTKNSIPLIIYKYKVMYPKENLPGTALIKNKVCMVQDLSVFFKNDSLPETTSAMNISAIEKYESEITGDNVESSKSDGSGTGFTDLLNNAPGNLIGGLLGGGSNR